VGSHSGKEILQDLILNYKDEYKKLTEEELKAIVVDFKENKVMKAKGFCVSMKSKMGDVTHTLAAIRNEVVFSIRSSG
jgi:ribosomal protein S13